MRCGLGMLVAEEHRSIRWWAAGSSTSVGVEWEMRRNELRVFCWSTPDSIPCNNAYAALHSGRNGAWAFPSLHVSAKEAARTSSTHEHWEGLLDDPDRELVPRGVAGIANQEKTWRCPCVLAFPGEAFQAEPSVQETETVRTTHLEAVAVRRVVGGDDRHNMGRPPDGRTRVFVKSAHRMQMRGRSRHERRVILSSSVRPGRV